MATLRVFCVTSPLWSRRTLICQSTRLLCRWNEPWVPCCPTLFPESVPLRPPGGGVPISPAGCQHAHGKRKSCLLPGAPLRLPLIHKPCRSTHLSSSLSVPCQSLYIRTIQVHQKHVLPVSVAQNLPQSLVKVKAPGGSAPHQPQSGMRHSLKFPGLGWTAGGAAPASTSLKATLLWMHITCFPGGIVGLVQLTWRWSTRSGRLLWLYCQEFASVWQGDFTWVQRLVSAASLEPGKSGYYRSWHSRLESARQWLLQLELLCGWIFVQPDISLGSTAEVYSTQEARFLVHSEHPW